MTGMGNEREMKQRSLSTLPTWFFLALIAITPLLAACPGGGKGGY
jgi:hypothetical protein